MIAPDPSPAIAARRLDWLTVLTYNTHVGLGLASGAVRWLLNTTWPDLVLLQEVQAPTARARARLLFSPMTWSAVGMFPASDGRGDTGTLVLARRDRLKKIGHRNPLVSPFHDRDHPERCATAGIYLDRLSGQELVASSMHTWTLGRDAAPCVRAGHRAQVEAYAGAAHHARAQGRLPIFGGDTNEDLGPHADAPIERALRAGADLEPARGRGAPGTRLDEIFAPDELDLRDYRTIPVPASRFPGAEPHHRAVVVDVGLPRKAAS